MGMIIKDQYGNEIEVRDIVLESENEFLSINVIDGKIIFTLNDERITHGQLDELNHDDHPQYLDAVRHNEINHSLITNIADLNAIGNVAIRDPANGDILTYINGEWVDVTPQVTNNHELLDNLDKDSHLQYIHKDEVRIVTAAHVYDTNGQPFVLTGKAIGALIAGLNAEFLNGKSASDFAPVDHTHEILDIPDHQHDGTDITGTVPQAQNAITVGNKTVDQLAPLVHTHTGDQIISRVPDSSLLEGHTSDYFAQAIHAHNYAPSNQGVTGGNDHTHDGTITKKVDHNNLENRGQNTHADIDSHLQNYANPHIVTKTQIGLANVDNLKQIPMSLLTAKGDLVIGTGTGVNRLAVGVNNSIPVADSTQALGIRWAPFSSLMGGPYAPLVHSHEYAPVNHDHNYALTSHDHDLVYFKLTGGAFSGNVSMNSNRLSGLPEPEESSDAVTKAYVDGKVSGSTYVKEVTDILNTPPEASTGARYIVGTEPTGAWALYANYIAQKTESGWTFALPVNGTLCPVTELNELYIYDSENGWYSFELTTDHGMSSGLLDDDHPQYAHISQSRTITGIWTFNTPFVMGTTNVVTGFNADKVDGLDASAFALTAHTHTESGATVLKYYRNNGTWDDPAARFAPLSHSHNDLYFTKTQLQTSGQALVHWDNLMSKPSGFVPNVHGSTHAAGGTDQINVNGLSGVLAQDQKAQSHDLLSKHTISGLTTGHFMKALSATTFGFASHGLTYTDVGAAASVHNHDSAYSPVSHNHNTLYAALIHTHDYALPDHNHNTLYAPLVHTHTAYALTSHDHNTLYAPIAKGVTNGDAHDHSGGDGAQIDHTGLKNIGSNTHAQIDTHLANAGMHRVIDDNSTTATNLWSAEKISTQLGTKANTTHNHSGVYEPVISSKGTAFNKNYGTSTLDVKMNGAVSVGGTDALARIDHVHPIDTSRAAAIHAHIISDVTGLQAALDGKSATSHNHTGTYEPANANIQTHVTSVHAPSTAQKNSDITKAEIEAKLTGAIATHSHAVPIHTHTQAQIEGLDDNILDIQEFMLTKGQPDGIASLDADGKVPAGQLPTIASGSMVYKGGFNGSSLPTDPEIGWTYACTTAGGIYSVGDLIIWNGTSWDRIPNSNAVLSVDGRTGAVTLSDRYAALSHTHAQSSITNLVTDLAGKAALSHTHTIANVTGLQTALDGKALSSHDHDSDYEPIIVSKLTAFNKNYEATATNIKMNGTQAVGSLDTIARGDHVHPVDTSRAPVSHTHSIANVTNLQTTLDGKAASVHSHADATTSVAGFMSAADKTKLNGLSNYTHPTGDGNLHVPLTSTTNNLKVLKAGAIAGSIAWGNVAWDEITSKPSTFTPATHTHTQAQSHGSPDTDTATTALHHTLGTGANQAAAGTHAAQHKSGGVDAILLTELGGTLTVAKTHASPDTDASATALHHTLGTGQYQAAAGNHTHSIYALTSHNHTGVYQPIDADLTAIAALAGTAGLLKKTAVNTWALDTSVYLTSITKAMVEAVLTGAISTHTHSTVASHTHAIADVTNLQSNLNAKANLASPALTGTPTAPTPAAGDNTSKIANTAFVIANSARATHSHSEYALTSHSHDALALTNAGKVKFYDADVGGFLLDKLHFNSGQFTVVSVQSSPDLPRVASIELKSSIVLDTISVVMQSPVTSDPQFVVVPFDCEITGWTIYASNSITKTINFGHCSSYDTFPGFLNMTSGFGGASKLGINGNKSSGSPAGWATTSLTRGQILSFGVPNGAACTITITLMVIKV